MDSGDRRPWIFVDVDGVLIPLRHRRVRTGRGTPGGRAVVGGDGGNPLLERLDPADGRRLLGLPGELVWATTWQAVANEVIAPRLGLPVLPVVDWPDADEPPVPGVHWKTMVLTWWAAGRPFVWLDDEITDADRRWVAAHHRQPALLHRVDPDRGLSGADVAVVRRWLADPTTPIGLPRLDTLIGRRLSQVVRLAWRRADAPDDLSVGPVHLVFDDGYGLLLDGQGDWTLGLIETCPGDDRWLDAYHYDWDGSRWIARDATTEPPFASVVANPLTSLDPIRNEIGEVVGLSMNFDGQVLALATWQGEIRI